MFDMTLYFSVALAKELLQAAAESTEEIHLH